MARTRNDGISDREATRQLRNAHKAIRAVRIFYGLLACTALLAAWITAPVEPATLEQVLTIAFAVVAGVSVAGALLVAFQPFVWGLGMGVLVTPVPLLLLYATRPATEVRTAAAFAFAVWGSLPSLFKVSRLLRDHPELYEAHRIRGTDLARAGRHRGRDLSPEQQLEVLEAAARKARIVAVCSAFGMFALAVFPLF